MWCALQGSYDALEQVLACTSSSYFLTNSSYSSADLGFDFLLLLYACNPCMQQLAAIT